MAYYIDVQRPAMDWIDQLTSAMDYYNFRNTVGGGITVKERYDYESNPTDFYLGSQFIEFDSVEYVGTDERRYKYIANYRVDHSDPTLTLTVENAGGYYGKVEPIVIDSPFYGKARNVQLVSRIIRDSALNDLFNVRLLQSGTGLKEGQAGLIDHPEIPQFKPIVIKKLTRQVEADSAITDLVVKVFKGSRVSNV